MNFCNKLVIYIFEAFNYLYYFFYFAIYLKHFDVLHKVATIPHSKMSKITAQALVSIYFFIFFHDMIVNRNCVYFQAHRDPRAILALPEEMGLVGLWVPLDSRVHLVQLDLPALMGYLVPLDCLVTMELTDCQVQYLCCAKSNNSRRNVVKVAWKIFCVVGLGR